MAPPPPPPPPPLAPEPEPVAGEPEASAPEPAWTAPIFEAVPPVPELEPPTPEPGDETSPTNVVHAVPSGEEPPGPEALYATAAIPTIAPDASGASASPAAPTAESVTETAAEPFREAELPLIPSGTPPSRDWEVDLGGLEDEVPRRDIEVDIAHFERSGRVPEERPVFDSSAGEAEMAPSSIEIPPLGGPLPEPPPSELETLAARASLTDLTRIVGVPPLDRPLSEDDVERVARRVVEILGERVVRKVAWDVVPEMAERLVRERLRELERAD